MMRSATDFLPRGHQHVDEFGDVHAAELWIRQDLALWVLLCDVGIVPPGIFGLRLSNYAALGRLAPYLERLCLRSLTPCVSRLPRTMW